MVLSPRCEFGNSDWNWQHWKSMISVGGLMTDSGAAACLSCNWNALLCPESEEAY